MISPTDERELHAVLQGQPLLQRHRELLGEPFPVLFSNLLFEAVQYLENTNREFC